MLASLSIRDIVLINRLELAFSHGFAVLTGETGAGKSILLDSLSLALGARGDGGLVRQGADQGQVTALFELQQNHPVFKILEDQGLDAGDGHQLILRRVQNADGRTRGFVNDQPVSATVMRQIGRMLVEIHGQHDERALVDPATHRQLLDAFGGLGSFANAVAHAFEEWRTAEAALKAQQKTIEEAQKQSDYLRAASEELQQLAPREGEEEELSARRQSLIGLEKIADDLNEAHDELCGNGSPVPVISSVVRRLERKADHMPDVLPGVVAHIDAALNSLAEAQAGLENALREAEFDPHELENAEERLFALRAAARKYSTAVENLPDLAEQMISQIEVLEAGEEMLAALQARLQEKARRYQADSSELSEMRKSAAGDLRQAVMQELPSLKLENADFTVEIESNPDTPTITGIDEVGFWVRTNPGSRAGPMMKIASGGELSRFLLAIKVALADKGSAPTLVFDEIDTGAGGAVADAIGARLARLSQNVQVISVTHAPQVAATAARHYLIDKNAVEGGSIETSVRQIKSDHREEEVARMLAGAKITEEARAAARQLIAAANQAVS